MKKVVVVSTIALFVGIVGGFILGILMVAPEDPDAA